MRSEHRKLWHQTYKPFGWEVLDIRYGGMLSRLDTVIWRLEEYLAGNIAEIPELEEGEADLRRRKRKEPCFRIGYRRTSHANKRVLIISR